MGLVSELRRRNVLRMVVLYVVAAWLIMQVAEVLIGLAKLPDWIGTTTLGLLAVGFPIALIFSWFYELTPEGISLEKDVDRAESITHVTGRRLDFLVISLLCAAVILFAYDKWWLPEPPEQSIAVLPFVNMSDDPDNEYFSDGVSEELLNLLARIPQLTVISRSSSFSFKNKGIDTRTIARQLNVAHVLEGSVRKMGNRVRITAQLIEARSDSHLWSETYDRDLTSVFAIQEEIAAAVVDGLRITLLGDSPRVIATTAEAYDLYLKGQYFFNRFTANNNKRAEAFLERAVSIDPGFSPAWTMLGAAYREGSNRFVFRSFEEGNERARHAIQQALATDPLNGSAYAVLALIEGHYDWDFAAASQHIERALELAPRDSVVLWAAAKLAGCLCQPEEAVDFARQLVAVDPISPIGYGRLGVALRANNQLNEAAAALRTALSLNPDAAQMHTRLGYVLLAQGDREGALALMRQEPRRSESLLGLAMVQHSLGDAEASDMALKKYIDNFADFGAFQVAIAYAFRGEKDLAFDWLNQAYENRDPGLSGIQTYTAFLSLHADPRWKVFIRKMGLPDC